MCSSSSSSGRHKTSGANLDAADVSWHRPAMELLHIDPGLRVAEAGAGGGVLPLVVFFPLLPRLFSLRHPEASARTKKQSKTHTKRCFSARAPVIFPSLFSREQNKKMRGEFLQKKNFRLLVYLGTKKIKNIQKKNVEIKESFHAVSELQPELLRCCTRSVLSAKRRFFFFFFSPLLT